MSKSVGNVLEPIQAITGNVKHKLPQSGLDTLRFWVAHEYYKVIFYCSKNLKHFFVTGKKNKFQCSKKKLEKKTYF